MTDKSPENTHEISDQNLEASIVNTLVDRFGGTPKLSFLASSRQLLESSSQLLSRVCDWSVYLSFYRLR